MLHRMIQYSSFPMMASMHRFTLYVSFWFNFFDFVEAMDILFVGRTFDVTIIKYAVRVKDNLQLIFLLILSDINEKLRQWYYWDNLLTHMYPQSFQPSYCSLYPKSQNRSISVYSLGQWAHSYRHLHYVRSFFYSRSYCISKPLLLSQHFLVELRVVFIHYWTNIKITSTTWSQSFV